MYLSPRSLRLFPRLAPLALLVFGVACRREAVAPAPPPPPTVTVVTVSPRTVPLTFEYPGRIEGSREVEVRARVAGILQRILFTEGQPVKSGQTLFVIDPAPYQAVVEGDEASLAEARARLAKAERELARLTPLLASNAVSRREVDTATSDVEEGRAAVMSVEARLRKAKLDLSYTRVEAPISGLSSRALFSEGSLVAPGESLLTRISQVRPIWVRFAVSDEAQRLLTQAIAAGKVDAPAVGEQNVEVVLADGSVHAERGRVNFADSMVDPATGSVDLRAELANHGGVLVPGQFVRVRLLGISRPGAILVPQRAVQEGETGKLVFVVGANGLAEARPVEVGEWIGNEWVVEKGLFGGEQVIVDGIVRVRPGAPVTIAASPAAAPTTGESAR